MNHLLLIFFIRSIEITHQVFLVISFALESFALFGFPMGKRDEAH